MASVSLIPLKCIHGDAGTQIRLQMSRKTIADYAQVLRENGANPFPPIKVVQAGEEYILVDGFHRVAAAEQAGLTDIEAEVIPGTRRDAILLACGANANHGLQRSNADKRRAVEILLRDGEWGQWSDREIARRSGTSNELVGRIRRKLSLSSKDSEKRTYTTRHGKQAQMDTRKIGRKGKNTEGKLDKDAIPDQAQQPVQDPTPAPGESPQRTDSAWTAAASCTQEVEEENSSDAREHDSPGATEDRVNNPAAAPIAGPFDSDAQLERAQQFLAGLLAEISNSRSRDSFTRDLISWLREA